MSLSARRRNSKWDMKEESQFLHRNMEENDWPESRYASFLDNKSCVWRSPEVSVINRPKWSTLGRGSRRDDNPDEHRGRNSNAMTRWEADNSYGSRMSPGLEDLRLKNHYRSPKNEWRRSRRSRSPSQGRSQSQTGAWSRSRSRSPVRGLRRESGDYDKNEGRSGASAQLCRNFAAGRCRRGDQCWFLHQDSQSYEDRFEGHQKNVLSKYSTRHISREYHGGTHRSTDWCEDFLEGNCRRGSNCRFLHPSDSDASGVGITNELKRERDESRDVSLERPGEREALRASDVPCKFFAAGRCRNGKNCRFFHDDWVHLGPDKRSRDGKPPLDHNANDPEKLWDGPKRSDNNISSGAANIGDDKIEKICAPELRVTSWSMDERWGHSLDEEKTHRGPLLDHKVVEIDRNETLHCKLDGLDDGVRVCEERVTENQLEDVEMSPEWSYSVRPSNHMDKGEHASIPNCETIKNLESSGVMMPPLINKISPIQQNYNPREIGVTALPSENRRVMVMMTNSHDTSANFSSARSLSYNGPASNALPVPLLNDVGQNQLASQVSSVILTSQSMVTNEQLSQLTNRISVPLFQSLASDPASHNGLGIPTFANSDGSVKPNSAVGIQENQALGLHIQYNPWCDNVEHEKHNNPAVFPPVLGGQEIIADRKNEGSSLPLTCPPTHIDNSNNLNPIGKEPNGMNHQQNKVEMGLNSESTKECLVGKLEETAEQNASLENNAADVKDDQDGKGKVERKDAPDNGSLENIDEDEKDENKKSKDAKVLRPFKFALAEFVKELLKPKWKEGQMSKDSYKVIVKKVVDKVTITMQGANIPQKHEKIEQYLSVSKPKLAKLVQAYVEKFQKEK